MNLLEETIAILKTYNKTLDDIIWWGREGTQYTGKLTEELDVVYDEGFGGNEIELDIILVGKDFWLSRGEYDGSEWWNYNKYPEKPATSTDNCIVECKW